MCIRDRVYNVGVLTLKSNDTVYIEEGAVVSGCVYADHCDNISIVGNGIIKGACWHLPDSNADRFFIYAKGCNNLLLYTSTLERVERRKELARPLKRRKKILQRAQWQVCWAMRLRRHAIIRGLRITRQITVQ